jgi:hypothetical protein
MGASALYYTYKVHNMGKIPDMLVEREWGGDSSRSVAALLQHASTSMSGILLAFDKHVRDPKLGSLTCQGSYSRSTSMSGILSWDHKHVRDPTRVRQACQGS